LTDNLLLFIDGSVNTQGKVGCGAYLLVHAENESDKSLRDWVKIKQFANASSSKLELQTLLWALSEIGETSKKIVVYTDSQNIVGLASRQSTLEQNNYHSAHNKLLNHHELYRTFFEITDLLDCDFVKVEGHKPGRDKGYHDQLFTLVDRAARKALRNLKE
jgi:ribonuclease HI